MLSVAVFKKRERDECGDLTDYFYFQIECQKRTVRKKGRRRKSSLKAQTLTFRQMNMGT